MKQRVTRRMCRSSLVRFEKDEHPSRSLRCLHDRTKSREVTWFSGLPSSTTLALLGAFAPAEASFLGGEGGAFFFRLTGFPSAARALMSSMACSSVKSSGLDPRGSEALVTPSVTYGP